MILLVPNNKILANSSLRGEGSCSSLWCYFTWTPLSPIYKKKHFDLRNNILLNLSPNPAVKLSKMFKFIFGVAFGTSLRAEALDSSWVCLHRLESVSIYRGWVRTSGTIPALPSVEQALWINRSKFTSMQLLLVPPFCLGHKPLPSTPTFSFPLEKCKPCMHSSKWVWAQPLC